jgi:hypothetical protein
MKAEQQKRQSNGVTRPRPPLSPARERLASLLASMKRPPDAKLTALQQAVSKAQSDEITASQTFESAKINNRAFDIAKRNNCEQTWVRAAAVLEDARNDLAVYQSTLPDSSVRTRATQSAVRDIVAEDFEKLIADMGKHAERFARHVVAYEAMRQLLQSKFNRSLDPEDAKLVDQLVMRNDAELRRRNLPMMLETQVLQPRGPAVYADIQTIEGYLGLLRNKPFWELDWSLNLEEDDDE